ncbi:acyl-coenzyme A synthetase ACSM3, mitochondrial isoform X4 [Chiloscyllium plagiosum]|uniref:acyl-coenzyme A synthetase ACSM3, mitochondrial isoform X4 n=1 Tax=Chiloscyllium plagiosum TaxID=36176 RepID=UPI001CB818AE|nr:acyl-coenzyme A synthetase ACSM3, mitochondrial isoform X4 [Chiloscyllium plagiosum]
MTLSAVREGQHNIYIGDSFLQRKGGIIFYWVYWLPYSTYKMNVLINRFGRVKLRIRNVNPFYLANCNQRLFWTLKTQFRSFSNNKTCKPQNFTDYESIKQQYKPQVPEYFNFASDILDKWSEMEKAGNRGSNPAFWWLSEHGQEVKWSFQDLDIYSKKVANVLSDACDLQLQDRVIVILSRVPEWWLINIACIRTGTVLIPGTTQLTDTDILHRLQASKAKCIITDDSLVDAVDLVASKCSSLKVKVTISHAQRAGWMNFQDLFRNAKEYHKCANTKSLDPMAIFFTSGTTGAPKMALHTHCSYGMGLTVNGSKCTKRQPAYSALYWLDLTPSDVMWNTSDTGWAKSAWSSFFSPWIQGACVFVHQMPRFDSKIILEVLSTYPITTFCSPPTVYRMLVQNNVKSYRFKSLQHCVSAGEPMNPEVMVTWKKQTGLDIYEGYGQTETVLICATFKGMKIKPGSMGKPSPAYNVQIVDENCNVVPPEVEGEIAIQMKPVKPFGLFSGYIDDPQRTATVLRNDYFLTGDRGKMDEDGYFWFLGRSDDVILSAGYRVGPFEVENALIEHPAVAESAVVGSPDPVRGEIEFVKQLPKTISGKIKRNVLRKKEWEKKN